MPRPFVTLHLSTIGPAGDGESLVILGKSVAGLTHPSVSVCNDPVFRILPVYPVSEQHF